MSYIATTRKAGGIKGWSAALAGLCLFFAMLSVSSTALADSITQAQALRIVNQYAGISTSPPTWPSQVETPDGPLLGNGDLGVVLMNNIDTMSFVFNKNEFWSLTQGVRKAMFTMSLAIPGMAGASYLTQEDLATGTVYGQFALGGNQITTRSWVQADDTTNNRFFTQFTYTGSGSQTVTVSLARGISNSNPTSTATSGGVLYIQVAADPTSPANGYPSAIVEAAVRVLGTTSTVVNGGTQLQFTLLPGNTVTLASSVMSNFDSTNYQTTAITNVASLTASQIATFSTSHAKWWAAFWAKSFIEIPNKTIEREFYGSLYLLASVTRANEEPPGLWGNWIQMDPMWNGDYTLNYNYESPFYATFPTNHVELSAAYDAPLLNFLPKAQAIATANGQTGALYPVHIGPLPSPDTNTLNQKSTGAFAGSVMLMHYYYTRDLNYASTVYPMLKQVATFWQNYLSWNGTSYDILQDAQEENDPYPQTDGVMSLGMVRFLLKGVIDMSTALNVDSTARNTWQQELSNLSPFPTFTRNSQLVFRETSVGRDWADINDVAVQHIYPGSQIGLASDPSTLQIALNMIDQKARWNDPCGTVTFYVAAARVGYNPNTILSQLNSWITGSSYPNLHIHSQGGGVENLNTVPSAMSEMMLQSFQGTMILFPDWPTNTNATFGDLMAYGNFLISSSMVNNVVSYVRITSQSGLSASVKNPWPGQAVQLYRNGADAGTLSGSTLVISTSVNDVLLLAPFGTSYNSILSAMSAPLASASEGPYAGTASAIPGTVQAENYDTGGPEIGYHAIPGNGSGAYRSDADDLEVTSDSGGGYDLGWSVGTQWFRYTVNVASAGTYTISFRVAAPNAVADAFHISDASGANLSGAVSLPATGGYQTWATFKTTVTLPAGKQVLTLNEDNGGWNLNYMSFAQGISLESAFNNVGTTADSNTNPGNFDGTGSSFSQNAFTAIGASPGATGTIGGVSFTWPQTTGSGYPDNVVASGQTIAISGNGSTLGFIVAGSYGSPSGTGTIYYTDGTTQSFTLTAPDWWGATGSIALTTSYQNRPGNTTASQAGYVYFVGIPLNSSKTVAGVQLPNISATAAPGVPALHVFCIAIG
jgi:alpha-L-fucosidase 2